MRTTIEIIIANQENQSCTVDELRLALEALRIIHPFEHEELKKLIDVVRTDRPSAKMRADFAWGTIERMFAAIERGAQVNQDLSDKWDYWAYAALPVDEVRRKLNVVPKG